MATNKDKIISHYDGYTLRAGEDNRTTSSRSQRLEFHYTKKAMDEYITIDSRVLEIGCGTGYYAMYYADKCKDYVGVDLFPPHIEILNKKISNNHFTNVSCQVGDATNLENISDNSFDVVLCFGPMYHLQSDERELVFAECKRVCKPGGVIAFAYTNKVGAYIGACVLYSEIYPNRKANDSILGLGITDSDAPFYFSMPEEMEKAAVRHGLVKIRNVGTDSFITKNIVDKMDNEKFAHYMALADEMFKHESCTGMSDHALLICRNPIICGGI
jgi:ubiquinone/menaquinone biosynthesis C-methylase UbiE